MPRIRAASSTRPCDAFEGVADEGLLERIDGDGQRLVETDAHLGFGRHAGGRERAARGLDLGRQERRGHDRVRFGEGDDAAHFVGELADVARPR